MTLSKNQLEALKLFNQVIVVLWFYTIIISLLNVIFGASSNITSIPNGAFCSTAITDITIPATVKLLV